MSTSLTGIKPTGVPHVGNYIGAIAPALRLVEQNDQALYFIADYHALTTVRDGAELRDLSYEVAATWLALGLDPSEVIFFRQSDVPEIFELQWLLSCVTPKGLLNRAHAYKAAVDANREADRDADWGVNAGLFNYPVLMAADILLFSSTVVPVGSDQRQHVEMARDIAQAVNRNYGDLLVEPEALIEEQTMLIPGLDGRKMSKQYGNTIPLFAPSEQMRKLVSRIITDSRRPEEPKEPENDTIYQILSQIAEPELVDSVAARYRAGGFSYKEAKDVLADALDDWLAEPRERFAELMADRSVIDGYLEDGAERARAIGQPVLARLREAVGVGRASDRPARPAAATPR
jgi:tryptophanyl-tRNA synthetase